MRKLAFGLLAIGLLAGSVSEAGAAACASGPYRAGCAGPRGAVVTHHRPYGYHGAAVVRPGYGYHPGYYRPHCYWRGGVRVCR